MKAEDQASQESGLEMIRRIPDSTLFFCDEFLEKMPPPLRQMLDPVAVAKLLDRGRAIEQHLSIFDRVEEALLASGVEPDFIAKFRWLDESQSLFGGVPLAGNSKSQFFRDYRERADQQALLFALEASQAPEDLENLLRGRSGAEFGKELLLIIARSSENLFHFNLSSPLADQFDSATYQRWATEFASLPIWPREQIAREIERSEKVIEASDWQSHELSPLDFISLQFSGLVEAGSSLSADQAQITAEPGRAVMRSLIGRAFVAAGERNELFSPQREQSSQSRPTRPEIAPRLIEKISVARAELDLSLSQSISESLLAAAATVSQSGLGSSALPAVSDTLQIELPLDQIEIAFEQAGASVDS